MTQKDFRAGDLVKSLKGHDSGRIYVVVEAQGEFASVCDGQYRVLANPKKKRQRHLDFAFSRQLTSAAPTELATRVEKFSTDAEIKSIIKKWRAYAERR